jgi:hypothetical protein
MNEHNGFNLHEYLFCKQWEHMNVYAESEAFSLAKDPTTLSSRNKIAIQEKRTVEVRLTLSCLRKVD